MCLKLFSLTTAAKKKTPSECVLFSIYLFSAPTNLLYQWDSKMALILLQHFCPFIAIFTLLCSHFQMVNHSASCVPGRLERSVSPVQFHISCWFAARVFSFFLLRSTCSRAFTPVGLLVRQTQQFDKCTSQLLWSTKKRPDWQLDGKDDDYEGSLTTQSEANWQWRVC